MKGCRGIFFGSLLQRLHIPERNTGHALAVQSFAAFSWVTGPCFPAGFIDDIQGMQAGDRRELEYTLPDTWWEPTLQGTEVMCNVTLKELFTWELPKVQTDSLVTADD